jgi:hypothetical protein
MAVIISDRQDLTYLQWSHIRSSSGTAGSFLKSQATIGGTQGADKLLGNSDLFHSCSMGPDGFFLSFADSIDIPSWLLYQKGQEIPVKHEDFLSFARQNLVDTTSGCEILNCSRQNLSYIVRQQNLIPAQKDIKGNLYLKKDIIKNLW